ncbi:hypothetical protein LIER_30051 [Lithospermum erythrorhizon]|uniref:PLD phosphodiesterase domain-containing protein n=1 Tax=Lithospermum erythrorhizon TaxID=34254 RepID=A0AAV3RQ98_LITER
MNYSNTDSCIFILCELKLFQTLAALWYWWGSGVVHAKVWISDHQDVYIGSANNDWKSLTQVKELGIYIVGCPKVVKHVETYYDNLWKLGHLNASSHTKPVRDEQWQIDRPVPCWSHFLHSSERCRSPLPEYVEIPHVAGYPVLSDPFSFKIPIEMPGGNISTLQPHLSYLSFAPPEVHFLCKLIKLVKVHGVLDKNFNEVHILLVSKLLFGKFQSDEHAWVETIKSVTFRGTVRINTMDWLGQSGYAKQTVFWSTLSSAVSEVVFSKQANVRILVAYWAHFIDNTDEYLKSLLYSNVLCSSSKYNNCSGKVEVKYYVVPEFNLTGPAIDKNGSATGNTYPGYTRVNHGKYAVSDQRAHIGTSNLIWDYFYTTAGVSFGTYNPAIVSQLQEIFDADWSSPYTLPINPLGGMARLS